MNHRGRGRPRKTERDHMGNILWFERLLEEELAALAARHRGYRPTTALQRAAARLGISERAAWRYLAQMKQPLSIDMPAFSAALRRLIADLEARGGDQGIFGSRLL